MRWAGYLAYMGEIIKALKILVGNLNRRDQSEDIGVDGRNRAEMCGLASPCSGQGSVAGSFELSNEPSVP